MLAVSTYRQLPALVAAMLFLPGCGGAPGQPSASSTPRDNQASSGPRADQSRNNQHIPTGAVKIVNRKTGLALHGDAAKRIEAAGTYWKIRIGESDRFLALAGWATKAEYSTKPPEGRHQRFLHVMPDSDNAVMLWEIRPLSGGFWTITSRATGKCLEIRQEKPVLWQSKFREGALEQQWRFEIAAATDAAHTGAKPAKKSLAEKGQGEPAEVTARYVPPVSAVQLLSRGNEHLKRAFTAGFNGDWALAVAEFTTAIQSEPTNARAYCGRAWARCFRQDSGDIRQAIEDSTTANQIDPRDPVGFCVRGAAAILGGDRSAAIPPLTEAIRLDPNNPSYYRLRAAAYYLSGAAGPYAEELLGPKMDADDSEAARLEAKLGIKRESLRQMQHAPPNADGSVLNMPAVALSCVLEDMTRGMFSGRLPPKSK
jgi:tetratricopeptide (TPR) repeat protein